MDGRPTCTDDASRLPADGTYDEEASIVSSPLVFVNVLLYMGEFSHSADRGDLSPVQYEPDSVLQVRRYAKWSAADGAALAARDRLRPLAATQTGHF
jgi:hypothetical protein